MLPCILILIKIYCGFIENDLLSFMEVEIFTVGRVVSEAHFVRSKFSELFSRHCELKMYIFACSTIRMEAQENMTFIAFRICFFSITLGENLMKDIDYKLSATAYDHFYLR